jgi:hypothetical protein
MNRVNWWYSILEVEFVFLPVLFFVVTLGSRKWKLQLLLTKI